MCINMHPEQQPLCKQQALIHLIAPQIAFKRPDVVTIIKLSTSLLYGSLPSSSRLLKDKEAQNSSNITIELYYT